MILIFSACSAKKDDSIPIESPSSSISPAYYLCDSSLISALHEMRNRVFGDPNAKLGTKRTYAFDLYVRTGQAYRGLNIKYYDVTKRALLGKNGIEWFFLSGGFGIIHALEESWRYQATFNRTIAHEKGIPFTANLWRPLLPTLCDSAISFLPPDWIYVFGSRDYTRFIKETDVWKHNTNIHIFESTGYPGPVWISEILTELIQARSHGNLAEFNKTHPRFTKQ